MTLLKLTTKVPAPGMDDMDWTEPFLERGTTMDPKGEGWGVSEPLPITKAWVKDEVLYMQAEVNFV